MGGVNKNGRRDKQPAELTLGAPDGVPYRTRARRLVGQRRRAGRVLRRWRRRSLAINGGHQPRSALGAGSVVVTALLSFGLGLEVVLP